MSLLESMQKRKLKETSSGDFVIELNMPKEYPPIKARKTEEGGVRDRFMVAKAELPDEITIVRPFNVDMFEGSNVNTIYVSPTGCDSASGSTKDPVKTLTEALKRAENKGGAKIVLKSGRYNIDKTVNITSLHSGTTKSPLIITAEEQDSAYISSSKVIPTSLFKRITDDAVLSRLKDEVRDKVMVANLFECGINDFGDDACVSPTLYFNGAILNVARYPNADEELLELGEGGVLNNGNGKEPWEACVDIDRCYTWQNDGNFWLKGNLKYEWEHAIIKVDGFDSQKRTMYGSTKHRYNPVSKEDYTRFYFVNVFEEIDLPGEWYLDKQNGLLYIYPPKPIEADDDIRMTTVGCDLIRCTDVENLIINRLNMGRNRGTSIYAKNCKQVLIQRCHFMGGAQFSGRGDGEDSAVVRIEGGKLNGVIASEFEYFAEMAFDVSGGSRNHLIPSNNFVQNNILHNPLIRHACMVGGCGNLVAHNYVNNTTLIDCGHNEGIFEYNVLEGGDTESMDSGMFYVAGGGCSFGANHYRYNYLFGFVKNDYGIYFDDMSRGMYAYGNIVVGNGVNPNREEKFGKWWPSGGRTYNHHNGGEHVFYNNISIDAGYFAFGGDISYWLRSFEFWKGWCEGLVKESLEDRSPEYLLRNPTYKDYCDALDQWCEDIKDPNYTEKSGWAERRLRTPWCNHYENNLIVRADRPYKLDNGEATATGLETNFITNDDPGFVDEANKNYALRSDSIVYKMIPDFVAPPFEKMGLVDDLT
ncbi:MAG: hypothetical protein E7312_04685 [Clostridiales bacterium]|nr:hypothetical protein [Clostridiales bacterium]